MNTRVAMGMIGWLVVSVAVVALLWLVWRRGWTLSGKLYRAGRFLPYPAPAPGRMACIVEAAMLGAAAAVILAVSATNRSTGGLLGSLDRLTPQYATANVIMFVCAVAVAAGATLIILFGRTGIGTAVMAFVLIAYGFVLNGGQYPGSWFLPNQMASPVVEYTIDIGGANVEGAELWVNGVYLGKTPYKTTLDDFEAKAPYWPKPPADYETDKVGIPQYENRGPWTSIHRRWIKFNPPDLPQWPRPRPSTATTAPSSQSKPNEYYARVRYAGEWGLAGGGSGSGGGGGRLTYRAESHFSVIFPERQKRLDALLDKARLADYKVDGEWLKSLETFGLDGWEALQSAAKGESGFRDVLAAWATWRCQLDKAVDAPSAWLALQAICDRADAAGKYSTDSIDGQAVEMLVPKLPAERLVDLAEKMIRQTGGMQYPSYSWGAGPRGPWFATNKSHSREDSIPPHAFVIAHAIWKLNESLMSDEAPTIVQERIVPALICWRSGLDEAAVKLGGPVAYEWLIRHDWRTSGQELWRSHRHDDLHNCFGANVNRWLAMLVNMPGQYGREFRAKHAGDVMRLADEVLGGPMAGSNMQPPSFLFLDLDKGRNSLAAKYWPSFSARAAARGTWQPLNQMCRYLAMMEPVSTAQQYVDAWRAVVKDQPDRQFAIRELAALPAGKRKAVIDAVRKEVLSDPRYAKGGSEEPWLSNILRALDDQFPDDVQARQIMEGLVRGGKDDPSPQNVALWLEHTRPDRPLVAMLAGADQAKLRLLAMGALREHPTPENRQILAKLLDDADAAVRAAAEKVAAHHKALAAEDPSRYASDVPSASAQTAPSTMSPDNTNRGKAKPCSQPVLSSLNRGTSMRRLQ